MKFHIILTVLLLLIFTTGVAIAEKPPVTNQTPPQQHVQMPMPCPGFKVLKCSPMLVEVHKILKKMQKREDALLTELLTASDEKQSDRIILRLVRLETDRNLALLKIQAKYARLEGMFDLERKIKSRIVGILSAELAMLN